MIDFFKDFPNSFYWLFKFNYQGLIYWYRRRKLYELTKDRSSHEDSKVVEVATEEFSAAEFACEFGSEGDEGFRDLVEELWINEIVTRKQLRILVDGKDLLSMKNGEIVLRKPNALIFVSGIIMVPVYIFAVISFSLMISISPVSMFIKIPLLVLFNGIFCMCAYASYYYSILPHLTYKETADKVNKFISDWTRKNQPKFTVIK